MLNLPNCAGGRKGKEGGFLGDKILREEQKKKRMSVHQTWTSTEECWMTMNKRVAEVDS